MRCVLLALCLAACSDSESSSIDGGTADVPLSIVDGPPSTADAPASSADGPAADNTDASPSLGQLCVTNTFDGGPGSCPATEVCCTTSQPYVCRLMSDCPGNIGFVPCSAPGMCCQHGVCCQLPGMTFCTKQSACNSYGGTIVACP